MQYYFMSHFFVAFHPVIARKYQSQYVYRIGESGDTETSESKHLSNI